ncbi:CDP-diacylglycerol--glycerol-3-phosphate 3-phosphatidyltransferase [Galliscardovia ingluviei]|uniref:CDP-diacylglycerol--glycerol-3-phosphate 3-phosphatidyltransferase n=1 Tax=Galliscardovia ingluviei TaxID=1769422 RepID=A0A8J3EXB0_9BIFI|nr:CDP-diacylglycerol--glycerol-3-phosphate 3-phosphatidyltransferase [Galliscardovia ingluviei]GGI12664.1 CDP-diacylglycerol--glycerol-3-phosphate 3-phosphatidyltransferase [Galliscardovia ingluviei]
MSSSKKQSQQSSLLEGWNTPANLVTFARIILVVITLILMIMAGPFGSENPALRWTAAVLFIVAASTDKLDGWLARRNNQVTELGKLMDPIADKLLMCAVMIVMSVFGELAWWITVLFLVREIGITVMRLAIVDGGGKVIAAAWPGKLKTVFQSIGLSMIMVPLWTLTTASVDSARAGWYGRYLWLSLIVVLVALVMCLYSGYLYVKPVLASRTKR